MMIHILAPAIATEYSKQAITTEASGTIEIIELKSIFAPQLFHSPVVRLELMIASLKHSDQIAAMAKIDSTTKLHSTNEEAAIATVGLTIESGRFVARMTCFDQAAEATKLVEIGWQSAGLSLWATILQEANFSFDQTEVA